MEIDSHLFVAFLYLYIYFKLLHLPTILYISISDTNIKLFLIKVMKMYGDMK